MQVSYKFRILTLVTLLFGITLVVTLLGRVEREACSEGVEMRQFPDLRLSNESDSELGDSGAIIHDTNASRLPYMREKEEITILF